MKKTKKNIFTLALIPMLLCSMLSCSDKKEQMSYESGVGEDVESLITSGRGLGSCSSLTGMIHVECVFVSDGKSAWNEIERNRAESNLTDALVSIEAQSETYGAEVSFSVSRSDARIGTEVPAEPNYYGWMEQALKSAGLGEIAGLANRLSEKNSADSSVLLFMLAREGRAYCSVASDTELEYGVGYGSEEDSLAYIIYGMFGAYELSFPVVLAERARDMLGDSVMNGKDRVDPLTAYLVGWTDGDASVREFFDGLSVTQAEIEEAREYDIFTGFASREMPEGRYVGYFVYGVADGKGKMTYNDGREYDGEWKNNLPHGSGTMTYPDNSKQTGVWVKGELYTQSQ